MSSRDHQAPRVGVSSCLLGNRVRYDGAEKGDPSIIGLSTLLQWVAVCPEVELGMPVPREPIQLEQRAHRPSLRAVESRRDHTEPMRRWAADRLAALRAEGVCAFVLKSRSPSCGLRVPLYFPSSPSEGTVTQGIFAATVVASGLPVINEDQLRETARRQAFVESLVARPEWVADPQARQVLQRALMEHR